MKIVEGIKMDGKKVIITGVPGVGKTTVVNEALKKIKEEGIEYKSINFGTFMFEVAMNDKIVQDRDEMRTLDRAVQKRLQQRAAQAIAKVPGQRSYRYACIGQDAERLSCRIYRNGCCARLCQIVLFSLKQMKTRS